MYYQFNYEQSHTYAKTTEIKLLKLLQLMIYKLLLSYQLQCIKRNPPCENFVSRKVFNLILLNHQPVV